MDFRHISVPALVRAVSAADLSARDLTEHALDRVAELNGFANALVAIDEGAARSCADDIDERVRDGAFVGPLAGVPVCIKDTQDVQGYTTTHGSALFAEDDPCSKDESFIAQLRSLGAVVIGKSNTSELEFSAAPGNSVFGTTQHPTHHGMTCGGSSGGSAVAVALGMVPLATGSDGGGSLRCPAAACGLFTYKPPHDWLRCVVQRDEAWGSLTSLGFLASDAASALYAHLTLDSRAESPIHAGRADGNSDNLSGISLGFMPDLGWSSPDDSVIDCCSSAVRRLEARGASIVELGPLGHHDPAREWTRIAAHGTVQWLKRKRGTIAWDLLDPHLSRLLRRYGGKIPLAEGRRIRHVCDSVRARISVMFQHVDAIVCPTNAQLSPVHAEAVRSRWVRNTYVFNLLDFPAASVPAGFGEGGSPVGLQIVTPPHREYLIGRLMRAADEGGFE